MWKKEEIEEEVRHIVAKSLLLKPELVLLSSRFFLDLEAESIDILDIRFAIESTFGFKFQNDEIRELLQVLANEHQVTEKDIPELFTVGRMADFVVYKLIPSS
ncbi:MAG: acyl carrier protein [Saprospiraceae bacterium]|nr:acyl carrier protein [Saprospiraceae bacterium]